MTFNDLRFSDLLITPHGYFFRFLEGGEHPVTKIPEDYREEIDEMLCKLKDCHKLDGGEFFYMHRNKPFRVAVIQTIDGVSFFLRKLQFPIAKLDSLNLCKGMIANLIRLGRHGQGLIVISGATGAGKTTTIYSLLLEYANRYNDIIVSVEDPPEIPINKLYEDKYSGLWYQIDAKKAGGYDTAMIQAMRYNPRFIFLGEIRTPVAAREALRAAINGHLVITTIHGNSIQGAIMALQQIAGGTHGVTNTILANGLLCVVQQRLIYTPKKGRKIDADMLLVENNTSILSKIREGKLELLNTDIEMQRMKLSKNICLSEMGG